MSFNIETFINISICHILFDFFSINNFGRSANRLSPNFIFLIASF